MKARIGRERRQISAARKRLNASGGLNPPTFCQVLRQATGHDRLQNGEAREEILFGGREFQSDQLPFFQVPAMR